MAAVHTAALRGGGSICYLLRRAEVSSETAPLVLLGGTAQVIGSFVGHHAHLAQPDALDIQPGRDLRDIPVLRPARENFVADHDQRGGPGAGGIRHGAVIAAAAQPA